MKKNRVKQLGILTASITAVVLLLFFAQGANTSNVNLSPAAVVQRSSDDGVSNGVDEASNADANTESKKGGDATASRGESADEDSDNRDGVSGQDDGSKEAGEQSASKNEQELSEPSETSLAEGSEAQDSGDAQTEQEQAGQTPSGAKHFTMPSDAEYEADEVLINVNPSASVEEVENLLAAIEGVASQSVSAEEIQSGLVAVKLDEGVSVEDAVNSVLSEGSDVVEGSQPNYTYQLAGLCAADLLMQLDTVESLALEAQEAQETSEEAEQAEEAASEKAEEEASAQSAEDVQNSSDESAGSEDGQETSESEESQEAGESADEKADGTTSETNDQQSLLEATAVSINDPYKSNQWALTSMRAYEAWESGKSDKAVSVAIIDDGVDVDHPDLAANIVEGSSYNALTSGTDVTPITNHGTHVAGIVSAVANNGVGVAGVSYNAGIVPIQVFSGSNASTKHIVAAIDYALNNADAYNIKVINLSLGCYIESDDFEDYSVIKTIRAARDAGIVTVASACNNGTTTKDNETVTVYPPYYAYPSDSASVVSVINLKSGGGYRDASGKYAVSRHSSSNYNVDGQGGTNTYKGKNISAPGTSIYSTYESGYGNLTGTSMASPQVAGVLALEFAITPSLTPSEAIDILYSSAHDIGDSGWDAEYGYGEVNAYAAAAAASSALNVQADSTSFVYNGEVQAPNVTVTKNGESLAEGTDYDLAYSDDGSTEVGSYTVTVNWKGDYISQPAHVIGYEITARSIDEASIVIGQDSHEYDCRALTPSIEVAYNGMSLVEGTDYTRSDKDNTNVGTATIALVGKGNYTGTNSSTYSIVKCPLSSSSIAIELSKTTFEYAGVACEPGVTVTHTPCIQAETTTKLDPVTLVEGTDYTVSYSGSKAVGTAKVTVVGKGSYTGGVTKEYSIVKPAITSDDVTLSPTVCVKGEVPKVVVVHSGVTLAEGTDYTVGFTDVNTAGEATATVVGKGSYGGTAKKTFTVAARSLSDADISIEGGDDYVYTGEAIEPAITVAYDGVALSEEDYTVAYVNNVGVGTATVSIVGTNASYGGTNKTDFNIAAAAITDEDVTLGSTEYVYTGTEIKPDVTVKVGDAVLELGSDYTVTFASNKNVGSATVTVEGKNNYSGKVTKTFQITARPITDATITVSNTTYTGSAAKPTVKVIYGGNTLAEGGDYTLECNSVNAGTGTVKLTGKGNFKDSATKSFTIQRQTIANPTVTNCVYTGKAQTGVPAGANYTLTGTTSATNAGTYTAYATPAANYAWNDGTITKKSLSWRISAASITSVAVSGSTYTGSAIKPTPTVKAGTLTVPVAGYTVTYYNNANAGTATVKVEGKGNYTGTKSATFRIAAASISSAKVASVSNQAYTAKAITPTPAVTYGSKTLVKGTDYTLSYSNNTNAGTATITITGKDNFSGTRKVTFKIVSPTVTYKVHVQTYGWQGWKSNGAMSGTSGQSKRLEAIYIKLGSGFVVSGGITYRTHVQTYGWQGWKSNGAMSGTSGQSKRLEAIQIKLTGNMANKYDVYYRVHAQTFGWMGWAKNGAQSGTAGYSKRLEAIQIRLVPKGGSAPGSTANSFRSR